MSDLTEFKTIMNKAKKDCLVAKTVALLDEEDKERFEEALATPGITHTAIVQWLRARDISVSDNSVWRHRQKTCVCNG